MKSSAKKIELASVDDLFSTEESRQDEQLEKIQEIPLSELHPFKDHPFKVKDDDAMIETADSIKKYGVLVPAIARPLPDGGYELVAGHRRRRASELAGKETMPVIVRDLDDDAATIIMVDSNLQRENLLPSERAFAYKMKLEAIKHQGARTDLTSVQVEQKLSARDQVAKEAGERSGIQVMRYVRLTELIPELLDMVDTKKSNTQKQNTHGSNTDSIPFRETAAVIPPERKGRDAMSVTEIENYRELILEDIEYDCLKQRYPLYLDDLNEIVELLVETVCAKRKTTRISGADFPHEIVRSRFLKLDSSHIEFVMDCLQKNTTQVHNIKQYLLAVLFNAPTTMNNHYTSLVNHDMHAGGW